MRTDKELKQLAVDFHADKIFSSNHIHEGDGSLLASIFIPLMFLDEKQRDQLEARNAAVFYEYYDKAGPRTINGYPMFTSMNNLNLEEWEKVFDYHEKIKNAIEGV